MQRPLLVDTTASTNFRRVIMRRKEHSAASVIHGTPRKSPTTFWTLHILGCLVAIVAIAAIVVALAIRQDRSIATIAAHDIARFVDGHLYYCFERSLNDASC
jgi:hypothetical protein